VCVRRIPGLWGVLEFRKVVREPGHRGARGVAHPSARLELLLSLLGRFSGFERLKAQEFVREFVSGLTQSCREAQVPARRCTRFGSGRAEVIGRRQVLWGEGYMTNAAEGRPADAGETRAAERADDRGRRLFWLALLVVEVVWLSAMGYGLAVVLG
jgi:hypothetical protein